MKRSLVLISLLFLALATAAEAQPSRRRGGADRSKPSRPPTEQQGTRDVPALRDGGDRQLPPSPNGSARSADVEAKLGEIQARIPSLSSAQQQSFQNLQQDLKVLAQGAQDAEDEIRQLGKDLQGMAIQPPDPALVQNLAADLQSAIADSTLSPMEVAKLTQDVNAVLNSANLSQSDLEVLKGDVEAILAASGVGQAEIEAVLRDLQAIYDGAGNPGASQTRSRPRLRGGR